MKNTSPYHESISAILLEEISEGSRYKVRVTSTSMAPILQIGDKITVQRTTSDGFFTGDLILTRRSNDLLTHRLILTDGAQWTTKADNAKVSDPPIEFLDILGRVIAIRRKDRVTNLEKDHIRYLNIMLGQLSCWEMKPGLIGAIFHYLFRMMTHLLNQYFFVRGSLV